MARDDLAPFGSEVFRPSPRQADLMIVAGTVTKKMAPQVVCLYNQMPEPKYVISMGDLRHLRRWPLQAVDTTSPQGHRPLHPLLDVYILGCPPRPEALIDAFIMLQKKIDTQALTGETRPRHLNSAEPSEFPVPAFGAHDLEPPQNPAIWHAPVTSLVQIEKPEPAAAAPAATAAPAGSGTGPAHGPRQY